MAESETLVAQKRAERGTRTARRLRAEGRVPGVLYGHKQETVALSFSGEELSRIIRHGVRVVDLQSDAGTEKALIKELQWDHLGKEVLHVDLARVSTDERIEISVRLELKGIAPGVTGGGILDQPMHTLLVECLAVRIPDSIRVNINELQLGAAIHVKDLTLPEGVKALADPEAIVVHVTVPAAEPETAAAPATGAAEPEIIGRKAAEGEETEEKK
jgi:large subunit ribosomal protein L25